MTRQSEYYPEWFMQKVTLVTGSSMKVCSADFFDVTEVKTVPYVPLSHPFVERLIGTVRREYAAVQGGFRPL